ncbi:B12-binding domain-containing radical SAM protein [bacterium]|nr:B12-binding domain-containing radical SAM protein [candidate division CSSED10-310 bacterium]
MKIVFVHKGREHLGIEWISAMLKQAGHEVALVYDPGLFSHHDNLLHMPALAARFDRTDAVVEEVIDHRPDMIAMGIYTDTYAWARGVARRVREQLETVIVMGGIHASLAPETVVADGAADYVVVGEGEAPMVDLAAMVAAGERRTDIANVWCRRDGRTIANPLRPPISLDSLPLIDKSLFEDHIRFRDDYMILTDRGCPFSCTFCCEATMRGMYGSGYLRRRSIPHVMHELRTYKRRYKYREVMFFDSVFFTDKTWLRELLTAYRKEIAVPFRCEGHVQLMDADIAGMLAESGCYTVDFGLQTINQQVRRELLDRRETNEQLAQALELCEKVGLKYDVDLILDLPGQSQEDFEQTAAFFAGSRRLNRLKFFNLTLFPGTPIVDRLHAAKLLSDSDLRRVKSGEMIGDFYHESSLEGRVRDRSKKGIKFLLRGLPLLPAKTVHRLLVHRRYRRLGYLPGGTGLLLQLLVALKNRDLRYVIHGRRLLFSIITELRRRRRGPRQAGASST